MKISLSLLALFAVALAHSGCNTLANRRALYSPKKGEGYWTQTLQDGSWRDRGTEHDQRLARQRAREAGAALETVPVVPPPPEPPAPEVAPGI